MAEVDKQLERISQAYDETIDQHNRGVDPLSAVPRDFKNSTVFLAFVEECKNCNMGNPEIREYLAPRTGMNFLDAGCGAGLLNYRLLDWPSLYHGVDLSPKLIEAMRGFVKREGIKIGGLWLSDLSSLAFPDGFFEIAACIGVLEYYGLPYISPALAELNRVLKPGARLVLDIPNHEHPHYAIMIKLEEYLKRPHVSFPRPEFEKIAGKYFEPEKINDTQVMIKYYLKALPVT